MTLMVRSFALTSVLLFTTIAAHSVCVQRSLAAPAAPAGQMVSLSIVGGSLIDGFGGPPRQNAVILVAGDKIAAVGDEGRLPVPPGVQVVDANGFTVMPGLIDTHVHLDILGHGDYAVWHKMVENEYAEVMRLSAAQLLAHGITTALDAGGDLKASVTTRDKINRGEIKGPRMLVSGGWIQNGSDEQAARHHRAKQFYNVHTADAARQAAKTLLDGGVDSIKLYTGLTVDHVKAITEEAHRRRKLTMAHVYTDNEIEPLSALDRNLRDSLKY